MVLLLLRWAFSYVKHSTLLHCIARNATQRAKDNFIVMIRSGFESNTVRSVWTTTVTLLRKRNKARYRVSMYQKKQKNNTYIIMFFREGNRHARRVLQLENLTGGDSEMSCHQYTSVVTNGSPVRSKCMSE